MQSTLLRYKIGFGVLMVFVLGMGIFTILQANNSRKDAQTVKAARSIADKLNSYTSEHQTAPDSLQAAHITNVPSEITYKKLSNTSYSFCVTYKTKNESPSKNVPTLLMSPSLSASENYDSFYDYDAASLYIDGDHAKGQKCQTVKLSSYYNANDTSDSSSSANSSPYVICGQGYNYSQSVLNVKATNFKADGTTSGTIDVDTYPSTTTVKLASNIKVFDGTCKELTLTDIHVDDFVSIYYNPYGSPATTLIKN